MAVNDKENHLFLLQADSFDKNGLFTIVLSGLSPSGQFCSIVIDNFAPLFFVPRELPPLFTKTCKERRTLPMRTFDGKEVDCLYFPNHSSMISCAKNLHEKGFTTFESDVHPLDRFLMERDVKGGFVLSGESVSAKEPLVFHNPKIRGANGTCSPKILSLDIETNSKTSEIYSIACYGCDESVFIRGITPQVSCTDFCLQYFADEKSLLSAWLTYIRKIDPDVIIGWNVVQFDLSIIENRCRIHSLTPLLGRGYGDSLLRFRETPKQKIVRIPGRVVIDIPQMLRFGNYNFESYSLDNVANVLLGKGKTIHQIGMEKVEAINHLFATDTIGLARYNLTDAQLTYEIMEKIRLLENLMERSRLCGHLLNRVGGSIAAFDYLYLPALHRRGYVAGNTRDIHDTDSRLTGGYVLEPKPGIYENILLLDFKSLYPTLIKTFLIDPLGYIASNGKGLRGPTGTIFSRDQTILPAIITGLLEKRSEAKRIGNLPLSYSVKILMNSFYGVLGSRQCRFFSPAIAQTITETGRYILTETIAHIQATTGYQIIYGDTDSLFVLLGPGAQDTASGIGNNIVAEVNSWLAKTIHEQFDADSSLDLEFESHFRYFFMPRIRSGFHDPDAESAPGSKKRYCGAIWNNGNWEMVFKGLETARSDWTKLAREFQTTLYKKVFMGEPVESYIRTTVAALRKGARNDALAYRKRLRKPLSSYTSSQPPHVQAARLLDSPESVITYFMTLQGPQPQSKLTAPLDYEHYIETQLKPIADSILEWIGLDFDKIISGQTSLFD